MNQFHVGIVRACWHEEIVGSLVDHCLQTLANADDGHRYTAEVFSVPGVVEIPLFSKKLIEMGRFDALVVAGLIADHGVYRHDFVARTVMDATMGLQMETGVPIIYGILTPQDFLSEGREAFFAEHFCKKGVEAANACMMTLRNQAQLLELKAVS